MSDDLRARLLELLPRWFRSRRPLRRFYWQQQEIDAARERARKLADELGWRS